MKHLFVPYELAKLAKEKGFDESCLARFFSEKLTIATTFGSKNSDDVPKEYNFNCIAPLYQQLVDWFREKYHIHIINSSIHYRISGANFATIEKHFGAPVNYYNVFTKALEEAFKLI